MANHWVRRMGSSRLVEGVWLMALRAWEEGVF
jgi:hypothetical protein